MRWLARKLRGLATGMIYTSFRCVLSISLLSMKQVARFEIMLRSSYLTNDLFVASLLFAPVFAIICAWLLPLIEYLSPPCAIEILSLCALC